MTRNFWDFRIRWESYPLLTCLASVLFYLGHLRSRTHFWSRQSHIHENWPRLRKIRTLFRNFCCPLMTPTKLIILQTKIMRKTKLLYLHSVAKYNRCLSKLNTLKSGFNRFNLMEIMRIRYKYISSICNIIFIVSVLEWQDAVDFPLLTDFFIHSNWASTSICTYVCK